MNESRSHEGAAKAPSPQGHFAALTSLRFVAAFLVLLFHFPPRGDGWRVVAGEGHVGVSIFFVLSGFLITSRYAETFARGTIDVRLYFVRRAARILPLYYVIFVLSQLVSPGHVDGLARWQEWTLTHALLGESLHEFVIPTSWSLTVEECFYALAPLVFLSVAAVRRRWPSAPLLAGAAVLVGWTAGLFGAGVLTWTILDGRGPGFLRNPEDVVMHTLLGRFYDFAVGAFAAFALDRTPLAPARAAVASVVGTALVFAAQWGMHLAGGVSGPQWARAWSYDLLLAPATALVIVSLTERRNPVARALGVAPLVYLGKASYALYLVQLTPLGRGFLYRFVSREDGNVAVAGLMLGMIAISILFYEVVEEPARRLVLRVAGDPQAGRVAHSWFATSLLAAVCLVLAAGWSLAQLDQRHGPVTLRELDQVRPEPGAVHEVTAADVREGRDVLLVRMPRRWREGWADDLRAPHGLLVFVGGRPVPFTREEPEGRHDAAFYRGPRAEYVALRTASTPGAIVLVRRSPPLDLKLRLGRLWPRGEAASGTSASAALP